MHEELQNFHVTWSEWNAVDSSYYKILHECFEKKSKKENTSTPEKYIIISDKCLLWSYGVIVFENYELIQHSETPKSDCTPHQPSPLFLISMLLSQFLTHGHKSYWFNPNRESSCPVSFSNCPLETVHSTYPFGSSNTVHTTNATQSLPMKAY